MKRNGMRWLFGWLVLCLLLGMASVGLAEEDAVVELEEENSESIELEVATGELVLEDGDLIFELNEEPELNIDLKIPEENSATWVNDQFKIDENGALIKFRGRGGDLIIPDVVTSIGDRVFESCNDLTSVVIPSSVKSIGEATFQGCKFLKSVTLTEGLNNIGNYAFDDCISLESITIPNSVSYIGEWAFHVCENMTCVTLPDGLNSIEQGTFASCKSLSSVTIPQSVTSIGDFAFGGCERLKRMTVPEGVASIGDWAFEFCTRLEGVNIPETVTSIGRNTFFYCTKLEKMIIPEGVTSIGENAFSSCTGLSKVIIPHSVTSIGDSAFSNCGNLTSVTIPEGVISIGNSVFSWCEKLASVKLPDSLCTIGNDAFGSFNIKSVTIGAGQSMADLWNSGLFRAIEKIKVTEDNPVYAVKNGILYTRDMKTVLYCPRNRDIVKIPNGTTAIGDRAFAFVNLFGITIPDSVTRIGKEAFLSNLYLSNVTIGKNVTEIGEHAFHIYYSEHSYPPLELTIHGQRGTYVESYAKKQKIDFVAVENSIDLTKAKITVTDMVHTNQYHVPLPSVEVNLDGKKLKKEKDYALVYYDYREIGTGRVYVSGIGKYYGVVKKAFRVIPETVGGLKLAAGKGLIEVGWKKVADVSGYQLQYSTDKSFSGAKKVAVSKASTVKRTITNLKANKTYYVRIRAYKKLNGEYYFSAWSAAKAAKVK